MTSAEGNPRGLAGPALLSVRRLIGERQGLRLWGPLGWALQPGQALHVQGPNGCGKTTLLRTLAGLRQPALGEVQQHAACWFIGHATPLAEDLGAHANLRLWLDLAGASTVGDDALLGWLRQWALPAERAVRLLSAGQRRKLALAPLALAPRRLWLLDEPFDALDTAGCGWLAGAALAHLAGGGALVLSSHQALPGGFPPCDALWLGARSGRPAAAAAEVTA